LLHWLCFKCKRTEMINWILVAFPSATSHGFAWHVNAANQTEGFLLLAHIHWECECSRRSAQVGPRPDGVIQRSQTSSSFLQFHLILFYLLPLHAECLPHHTIHHLILILVWQRVYIHDKSSYSISYFHISCILSSLTAIRSCLTSIDLYYFCDAVQWFRHEFQWGTKGMKIKWTLLTVHALKPSLGHKSRALIQCLVRALIA
jgi:hypothetical protein